jgi:hypothetical protein
MGCARARELTKRGGGAPPESGMPIFLPHERR